MPQLDIQNPLHNSGQQIFSQPHQEALQNILRNLNIPQLDIQNQQHYLLHKQHIVSQPAQQPLRNPERNLYILQVEI